MKLGAVHCRITKGGALDVFKNILQDKINTGSFSQIQIFTLYSEIKYITINGEKIKIITALPNRINIFFKQNRYKKIPILKHIFDYRNLIFFYPILMKKLSQKIKKYNPKDIFISSFAIAKNIEQCKTTVSSNKKGPKTTLYLHSPMQYIWTHKKEYIKKITGRKGRIFKKIINKLQKRDLQFTNYDKVYSNSIYTQKEAKKIYNIESEINYPKINKIYMQEKIITKPQKYMIYVGRIVKFVKEVDTIIKVFNKIGYPLIIIGSGPDEEELKKKAKKNITFTGRNPPNMINIIKNATGAINITKESFGLGTAECLSLGIPILGYNKGATKELVNNTSGILIKDKNEENLIEQCKKFISTKRERKEIANNARKMFNYK